MFWLLNLEQQQRRFQKKGISYSDNTPQSIAPWGSTRDNLELQDIADLLHASDAHFALVKEESFDFSMHKDAPLDYDRSHFKRDVNFLEFERKAKKQHASNPNT